MGTTPVALCRVLSCYRVINYVPRSSSNHSVGWCISKPTIAHRNRSKRCTCDITTTYPVKAHPVHPDPLKRTVCRRPLISAPSTSGVFDNYDNPLLPLTCILLLFNWSIFCFSIKNYFSKRFVNYFVWYESPNTGDIWSNRRAYTKRFDPVISGYNSAPATKKIPPLSSLI